MSDLTPYPPSAEFLTQVTRAQRSLYGFITSLVWQSGDADDVLQETNLVLWRKAGEFDPGQDFMAWALRIAQLQAMAHLKKQRRRFAFDDDLLAQLADESLTEQCENDRRRAALTTCLKKLSDAQRRLISQRYEPGASVNSLAAARGTSPKALSEMLRRIRHALSECIERTLAREAQT
jgi:RNA polymerase sigma-70 factor (ECF subfamily)